MSPIKISVVICTYNGQKYLKRTLQSLIEQNLSAEAYEILVINNNSTDATAQITVEFQQQHPDFNIHHYLEPSKGLSFARNRGIQEAKSPIIVYIDDDAEANSTFLAAHVEVYQQHADAVAAGGKVVPEYSTGEAPNWLSSYIDGVFSLRDLGDEPQKFNKKYPAGCNMSFKKSALKAVGGFNNNIKYRSDEKFVFLNLIQRDGAIYYTPKSVAIHIIDVTRQSEKQVIKVSQLTGAGERERLWKKPLALFMKLVEYKVKFGASLLLSIPFLSKGQFEKAYYLIMSRWYVLQGFVFYRN